MHTDGYRRACGAIQTSAQRQQQQQKQQYLPLERPSLEAMAKDVEQIDRLVADAESLVAACVRGGLHTCYSLRCSPGRSLPAASALWAFARCISHAQTRIARTNPGSLHRLGRRHGPTGWRPPRRRWCGATSPQPRTCTRACYSRRRGMPRPSASGGVSSMRRPFAASASPRSQPTPCQ